jgi:glyoxylase-like metal-dependent hydrolase (beta-lactamase superfamily II)
MAEDIPYNRSFDLQPGHAEEVAPGVRRIVANNPGPFTFKGTVSYIVGRGKVAIIDPGPDDPAHIAALLDSVRGETVTHIFVTHTHRDHSPGRAGDQGQQPAPRFSPKARIAPHVRCTPAKRRAWKRPTTRISVPIARSRTAKS